MPNDPRILILFGTNALLLFLNLLVNSQLAAWSLNLVLFGPMIVLPALFLRHTSFFVCTVLTGLWIDAALPVPFGLFTLGFLCLGTLIFLSRGRFRAEHNYHPILIAHILNLFAVFLLTAADAGDAFGNWNFWMQIFKTLLLSHLALLAVAPWFFNLERLFFEIFRVDTEPEDFPLS